jgi:hypothetical protein
VLGFFLLHTLLWLNRAVRDRQSESGKN